MRAGRGRERLQEEKEKAGCIHVPRTAAAARERGSLVAIEKAPIKWKLATMDRALLSLSL